ncbi:hypothetical protein ACQEVY_27605 [Streptomyces sp. CA-288835]|uniref:hypothetical protein n=1 Tax=Streptomyces sp. CA-288835 TaxID=3240069 RepID=UPI003D94537C
MTTQNDAVQLPAPHKTWWKAPLVTSLPGLPLLAWEYSLYWADGATSGYGLFLYWAMALFALAWALPHRRSVRTYRTVAASLGLGFVLLPVMLVLLLGAALASS